MARSLGRIILLAIPVITVVTIIGYTIWYVCCRWSVSGFLDGAVGNFAATLLGLILGVPVALYLDRRRKKTEDACDQAKERAHTDRRRSEILAGVKRELADALEMLHNRYDDYQAGISLGVLQTEVWDAFSDGGETKYINDPTLLVLIAKGYHHIKTLRKFEEHYVTASHFHGEKQSCGHSVAFLFFRHLSAYVHGARISIGEAIHNIDRTTAEKVDDRN